MTEVSRRHLLIAGACAPLAGAAACAAYPDAFISPGSGGMESIRRGTGTPPVVLIHGLGDDMATWRQVIDPLALLTTVIAYNRFGYGNSGWTARPRDAVTVSDELAVMLGALGVTGPVILVGHSLGGVYAQVHARRFPGAVAGMVLVDTTVPGQKAMLERMMPVQHAMATVAMASGAPMVRREFENSGQADSQIEMFPAYRAGPVVMLAAGRNDPLASDAYADGRRAAMQRLAIQYDSGVEIIDSGHFIHHERPQALVNAVGSVLARTRAGRRS
jgi:pimeloyl-ACP methyl ester carboxylesterase